MHREYKKKGKTRKENLKERHGKREVTSSVVLAGAVTALRRL